MATGVVFDSGDAVPHAPPPKSAIVLHPRAIAHPKQVKAAEPVVKVVQAPTGAGSPTDRRVLQFAPPSYRNPEPNGGCKGCGGSKAVQAGDTPVGFTRDPQGGTIPTDSRPGGGHSTPVQIRPQATGRVGLRAQVLDAATPDAVADVTDPAVLQPGNVAPDLPSPVTKLGAFFVENGKPQWEHIILTVIIAVIVYKVIE